MQKEAKEMLYGILNWYPFKEGSTIGFAGDCPEDWKEDFLHRGMKLAEKEPCDYMVAMNFIENAGEPREALAELRRCLKPEGHLFVVCENRLGLRYFIGDRDPFTNGVFDGVENYRNHTKKDREALGGRCFAKYEIEEFLHQAGFGRYHGYSVLPGLEMPQQIYAWDYIPEENMEIRFTPLYHNPTSVFLNENKLYESIIKNGMFHQMANAYLIDCTVEGAFYEINHVTTSMDRGRENATATILQKDGQVVKKALYPEGNGRIQKLEENTKELCARGLSVVSQKRIHAGKYGDGEGKELLGVCMPYVKAKTALDYLRELIYEDRERFIEEMERFLNLILQSSEPMDRKEEEVDELGVKYRKAYIDLVPLNCFYMEGEFVFYDQEFCEDNYWINVVLYRAISIVYMYDKSMEAVVPSSYFTKKYGLFEKANVYRDMGDKFISKLRNREKLSDYNAKHMPDLTVVYGNRQRMNYSVQEYNNIFFDLMKDTRDKSVYLFGSGQWAQKFVAEFGDRISIKGMLDNNEANRGKRVNGIEVMSPDILKGINASDYKVIVCVKQYASILKQLEKLGCKLYGIYDPFLERPTGNREEQMHFAKTEDADGSQGEKPYHIGYVAGVFDLFHIGHLNILKRAKQHCDYLIVGVVSDEQAGKGKAKSPYVNERERKEIVEACKYADEVFILPAVSSGTRDVYKKYHFDVQFSGSDYAHDPKWLTEQAWLRERGAELVFFPYTESTSSTKLRNAMENREWRSIRK